MALADGLVGYWSPWLGSSGYRLLDRTRYANHGTLTNMDAGTDWVGAAIPGRSGYALDFDGTDDSVNCGNKVSWSPQQHTMAIWLYWRDAGKGFSRLFSYYHGGPTFYQSSSKTWTIVHAATVDWNTGIAMTANVWQFIVYTRNGSTADFYINGVNRATNSAYNPTFSNTNDVRIGAAGNGSEYTSMQAASASIYTRTLAAAEILQLYNLGPGWYRPYAKRGYGYAVAGFKAYWHRRQSQVIGGGLR